MHQNKYSLSVILLFFIFCFHSCTAPTNKKKFIIGFSQCTGKARWRQEMLEWMKRELSFYPEATLIYKDAQGSSNLQMTQIKQLLADSIDLLIVSPNEPKPLTPIVENLYQRGIPVIVIERKTSSSKYSSYIGANNYEIGALAGSYIRSILKDHGNIIEITGNPNTTPAVDRHRGFRDAIKDAPGINVIAQFSGGWYKDSAALQLRKIGGELNKADLIFAQNDVMALGAYQVYRKADIEKKIKFIGIDGLPGPNGGIQLVLQGILNGTILYPTGGAEAIETAMKILDKKPYNKRYDLQTLVIDSSNAKLMDLQLNKLASQQTDIERRQKMIEKQIVVSENQKIIIYLTSISLALALILGSVAFYYLKENKKINRRLEKQNEEISNQRNQLIDQKEQLIEMAQKVNIVTETKLNFFTKISHEFRTPLTLILGSLEHLLAFGKTQLSNKVFLEMAQKNTFRLLKLVNELITFRKIEDGKMMLKATKNDLVGFIFDISDSFQELSRKQHIRLQVRSTERKLIVWYDINMIDKVFFNLLSNAFKFTPENGTIIISVKKSDDGLFAIINIEDSGIGMAPETVKNAFELFFQGTDSNFTGFGLGLNLSKELINLHHGSIAVTSELNKGSNFEFKLPLGESHLNSREKVVNLDRNLTTSYEDFKIYTTDLDKITLSSNNKLSAYKENTLLIIEDSEDLRGLLKARLENEYNVSTASRGDDGLNLAYEIIPDIILCDIVLPGQEGIQIVNTLKKDIRTSHIPIILITAKGNIEEQIKGMRNNVDAFMVKPFNLLHLEETIKSLLKNREILKSHYTSELLIENKFAAPKKTDRKFVNEFVAIVENNLPNENFSVDEICRTLGISRVQLYRKVKALFGYNVNDYIMNSRLQKAKYLLTNEELSIAEIASQVGFSSQAYFSRLFKSKFCCTPSEYKTKTKFI